MLNPQIISPDEQPQAPQPVAISPQDVVTALEFLRAEVFSQANIDHVKDIVANLSVLGDQAKAAYQTVKKFIAARRSATSKARSLDLTRALDRAGVTYLYDQFEHDLDE